jgi:xanthine dehydrogenase/oxidase
MPLIAKLLLASGERRRLLLAASSYSALLDAAAIALRAPCDEVILTFLDSDGDTCCIGSDEEFAEALRITGRSSGQDTVISVAATHNPSDDYVAVPQAASNAVLPSPLTPAADYSSDVSFKVNGTSYTVSNPDPNVTLAQWLRSQPGLTGTKISCEQGGCGACTVMLSLPGNTGFATHMPVNACLRSMCAMDGYEVTTVEGVGNTKDGLHPVQQRIVDHNASQCGFCTPGFVVNMYSLLAQDCAPTAEIIEQRFDGHICRCTGYRPILDAVQTFAVKPSPSAHLDCGSCEHKLSCGTCDIEECATCPTRPKARPLRIRSGGKTWLRPVTMADLQNDVTSCVKPYRLNVGGTSLGVYKDDDAKTATVIDVSAIPDLQALSVGPTGITAGAAVNLEVLRNSVIKVSASTPGLWDTLVEHFRHLANVQVRSAGCWAGNIAMGLLHVDFPSDLIPIFVAAGATISIISQGQTVVKSMYELVVDPSIITSGQGIIASVTIPSPDKAISSRSFKIMSRRQNAHAYVNAGFNLSVDLSSGIVSSASIVFGGCGTGQAVAAQMTAASLIGKALWDPSVMKQVLTGTIPADLKCSDYHLSMAQQLFYRFVLNIAGSRASQRMQSGSTALTRNVSSGTFSFPVPKFESVVGQPIPKTTIPEQASGSARYTDDVDVPSNTLYAAFVLVDAPNGTLQSVDATQALAMPGVFKYVDASSVPEGKNVANGEPIFAEKTVGYNGQCVGVILADTQAHADAAAMAVVCTVSGSVAPVLDITGARKDPSRFFKENVPPVVQGDVDAAFKTADFVIEGTACTGLQYHFYMETQSCCVVPTENDGFTIHSASQWPVLVQQSVAGLLGIPEGKVDVIVKRLGGGYGGKITHPTQIACAAALCSSLTRRPVKTRMSLASNIIMKGKRHSWLAEYKVGIMKTGKITAIQCDYYTGSGHQPDDMFGALAAAFDNVYNIPNWKATGFCMKTDLPTNTACRAPGMAPGIFFAEVMVEHAAAVAGLDPLDVKTANLYQTGDVTPYGMPLIDCSVSDVIALLKDKSSYDVLKSDCDSFNKSNRWRKRGVALTPVKYGIGWDGANYGVLVNINSGDGTVMISHSGIEMGQGIDTKVAQCAAEILKCPLEKACPLATFEPHIVLCPKSIHRCSFKQLERP